MFAGNGGFSDACARLLKGDNNWKMTDGDAAMYNQDHACRMIHWTRPGEARSEKKARLAGDCGRSEGAPARGKSNLDRCRPGGFAIEEQE
jgi:hypothetical protein